jgi:misacylated tRNA(Ala) deacylase
MASTEIRMFFFDYVVALSYGCYYSCCGTHLPSIHNLQLFLLPHTDALARSGTTSARLYFVSGPRLIAHLTSTHSLLSNTAAVLSCGTPLVPDRVTQVLDERKKAEKRVDDMGIELARFIAEQLVTEMNQGDDDGLFKKHVSRTDDTANVLGLLSAISFAVADMEASKKRPYVVVLTSSPSLQTASSITVVVVFGSDEKVVKAAGEGLKAKLGVKGGGKGTKWSGKFIGVWKKGGRGQELEDLLSRL